MILPTTRAHAKNQKGAVLVMSLLFLTVMTIMGVSSMSGNILDEKMVGNFRQQRIAFQAADSCTSRVLKESSFSFEDTWTNVWENTDHSIKEIAIGSVNAKNNATYTAEKKFQMSGNPLRSSGYSMEEFGASYIEYRCVGTVSTGAEVVIRQGSSRITPKVKS